MTTADRLRPQFDEKGVDLSVASGPPLLVEVDPDRIAQVLTNLLGNALTYTPAGGRVEVRPSRDHERACVTVSDTGIGLTAEDAELIFDRFYRVRGAARPSGGSGIGLTIARGLARAHHGDVTAASNVNHRLRDHPSGSAVPLRARRPDRRGCRARRP